MTATRMNSAAAPAPATQSLRLTPRELEVLHLLADGLSTHEIAGALCLTFKTAACHRWRILTKMQVNNTVAAVRLGIRLGMIRP